MASCIVLLCYVVCSIFSHIFVGCTISVAFVFLLFSQYRIHCLKQVISHPSKMLIVYTSILRFDFRFKDRGLFPRLESAFI